MRRKVGRADPQKGISEVIGYIIIMGIILTSVGMVYTNAIPVFENSQDREHLANTEKTFDTLSGNIDELIQTDVTRRGTEIRLWNAEVSVGEINEIVGAANTTSASPSEFVNRSTYPIVYKLDGSEVVYSNGAVLRASGNSSGMVKEPNWEFRETDSGDVAIMPIVRTRGLDRLSGDGTVLIRTRERGIRNPPEHLEGEDRITFRVVSDRYVDAWESYFSRLEGRNDMVVGSSRDGNTTEVEVDADRVIYSETRLQVVLNR